MGLWGFKMGGVGVQDGDLKIVKDFWSLNTL